MNVMLPIQIVWSTIKREGNGKTVKDLKHTFNLILPGYALRLPQVVWGVFSFTQFVYKIVGKMYTLIY